MTAAVATANCLQSLLVGIRRRLTPQELGVEVGPRQSAGPGVSQEQVARALGISLRHYSGLETGSKRPSLRLLASMTRVMVMSEEERAVVLDSLLD
jgi:DNA-binding XRE family transcriptional regulator